MNRIYTVTLNPARDRSVVIENFAPGKVNRITRMRDDPGGKGINVSKAILALGGQTVAMGILGGGTGAYIRDSLEAMGMETDFVWTQRETRTNLKINDPVRKCTTDINEPGVIEPEDAEKLLEKLLSRVRTDDVAVIAGKLDTAKLDPERWIRLLKQAGARVFLDTEGEALKRGVQAGPYLIKPNDAELSQLLGRPVSGREDCASAARRIVETYGVHAAAVSLGSEGAVFVTRDGVWDAQAVPVEAVNTVGAGDTMMAALAWSLTEEKPFEEACRLAVAAGAAAVTCDGTQSPDKETILTLMKQARVDRC